MRARKVAAVLGAWLAVALLWHADPAHAAVTLYDVPLNASGYWSTSGTWTLWDGAGSSFHGGSLTYSDGAGTSSGTFTFSVASGEVATVRLIGRHAPAYCDSNLYALDGGSSVSFSQLAGTAANKVVSFSISDVGAGSHSLVVTEGCSGSGLLTVDAFEVDRTTAPTTTTTAAPTTTTTTAAPEAATVFQPDNVTKQALQLVVFLAAAFVTVRIGRHG